jgi:hypothetical protein
MFFGLNVNGYTVKINFWFLPPTKNSGESVELAGTVRGRT